MTTSSRRQFLKLAGTGAAAAGLTALPPSIRRALAIPANNATGSIRDVQHVIILMQENRSFDNYFGTFKGVRGFGDRFPIPTAGGRNVWQQQYTVGSPARDIYPYHLDSTAGNAQRVSGTPHTYPDAQAAWDLGRIAKWPDSKNTQSMGYFKQAEVDFQFALANAFTLCDAYHCAFHGGTNPNRVFHWTGTNDPLATGGGPVIDNSQDTIGASTSGYRWTTYAERLQAAGVTWKVYQNMPDNFSDNPLAGFVKFRQANEARGNASSGSPYPAWTPADDAVTPLLRGIANTMPDSGFMQSLRDDIAAGTLPQVSWIVAPATYSEHPGPSSPVQGAWYTQQLLDILTSNPDVWSKTVLLINFDENDGYFDHAPPPCAPASKTDPLTGGSTIDKMDAEYHTDGKPYGPGPRVPMYVVSPWSRGGWVNSQVFDHTSVLRFLEQRFGVLEPNISDYRRAVCGDLTSAFNFVNPNNEVLPTLPSRTKTSADAVRAAQQALAQVPLPSAAAQQTNAARQDPGSRPSRALPYELHVSARENANAANQIAPNQLTLILRNTGRAAAVFHVYDRLHLDRAPRRYAVEAGKELFGVWDTLADGGKYDLWVLGPNGFHRSFVGDTSASSGAGRASPEVRVCYDPPLGTVRLTMMNLGTATCQFSIKANAYRNGETLTFDIPAGMQLDQSWPVGRQGNWYDFTASVPQGGFQRRFAGRMETGADGVSDPAIAKSVIDATVIE
ncbi:phosphocholine-specific phospholipase C [Cupriavidus sp. 2SB]|uniref:phosphocholine-specific phospholipase C n=1 Tax=Cupriavidus sp. 2SB TaxID=2502199 RepID=UPI0010F88650|nr:phospholipase C, phosphocholine-specific [Cupriavidus sp. 2SB]